MSVHNQLDQIINECGLSIYEEIIASRIGHFVENCSLSIRKKGNALNSDELRELLYLLKYLYQHQSKSKKSFRLNKQLCIKVLFVILLNEKQAPNWKQLLKQSVIIIAGNWAISPDEYPFLTEKQRDKIVCLVDVISHREDIHTRFLLLNIKKVKLETFFYFIQDEMYDEFIEIYETLCRYPERNEKNVKYLKAIFIFITEQKKRQKISEVPPAILKSLLFHFCILEIHRLFYQLPAFEKKENINCISSEKLDGSVYKKSLFIKTDTRDYNNIPTWAELFFVSGQRLAIMAESTSDSLVVGFSLPSKAYAVLFFLLGYETWKVENAFNKQKGEEELYFKELSKCIPDEALLILLNQRWKRCWFKGIGKVSGEDFIKVDVPGTGRNQHCKYISMQNIFTLRKAVDPEREVAANQIGFEMTGYANLLKYYNKKENKILQFLINKKPSFIVIGNILSIQNEIKKGEIFFNSDATATKLSFQDIIRFKNFMTDFDLSRGVVQSTKESREAAPHISDVVIYDGSLSYVNRQGDIQSKLEIVFLDRTEPQFSNACGELMARYCDREDELNLFDRVPASIEVIAFKE